MTWQYRVKAPDEKVRDPIQGEFFSTDAVDNPADALIREAIQNSIDARLRNATGLPSEPLKVRIFLGNGKFALSGEVVARWFEGAWEHFRSPGNGLRFPPKEEDTCAWLVFEDFNTTGLTGDIRQTEPSATNTQSSFFHFFRAEGRSGKTGDDLGRWGIGKCVFPRASLVNSFFGLSRRHDDNLTILMGQSVFKSHRTNGKFYCPDGYFGIKEANDVVIPFTDSTIISKFANTFKLEREAQPGLSIVVPWVDPEITINALIEATIRGYFIPILNGSLSVIIETPDQKEQINKENLHNVCKMLVSENGQNWASLVKLADWALLQEDRCFIALHPCNDNRPQWVESLIPVELKPRIRESFESGENIAVRAALTVRETGKAPKLSSFDFFLCRDETNAGRPTFVREGLTISKVDAPRVRGIQSLVVIGAGPLGTLLGDAENPAHEKWHKDGQNFKGKYTYGKSYIEFVTKIVANFTQALTASTEEVDHKLLLDFFSIPSDDATTSNNSATQSVTRKDSKNATPETTKLEGVHVEPRKKRFRLSKSHGGFAVTNGDATIELPTLLEIRVAYDVRHGNPLKKYNIADFELIKSPIRLEPHPVGLTVVTASLNRLLVEILDAEFKLTVRGFDENRDLVVDAKIKEA